jgi:pimeloyl-ACP methyl ester carboxylesterase
MKHRVVALHGLPSDREAWSLVARRMESDAAFEYVDYPDVERYDDGEGYFRECERRVDQALLAGEGPVVLVAHSYGTYLGSRALGRHGARVAGAVLCAGYPRLTPDQLPLRESLAGALESGALTLAELFESKLETLWGEAADRNPEADRIIERQGRTLRTVGAWVKACRFSFKLAEPAWAATTFSTPTTILHPRGDRGIPLHAAEELAQLGGNAALRVVETTSHFIQLTHPELVAEAIRERSP